jgi:iron complex outermembrane receptor protein
VHTSRWSCLPALFGKPARKNVASEQRPFPVIPPKSGRQCAFRKAIYCLLLLAFRPVSGWAGDSQAEQGTPNSLKQLSLEQLGNVQVTTASKEPEELWRTPAAIYVITQEDIRRSGATSIPEIFRLAPGVEVSRTDSDHWAIGVRGFAGQFSRSLLVLIDGRSVYTSLFAGVYWDVQDTLIEDIDRIEIIRGPGGTIWGANAVNGVINIITKNAKDTHGTLISAAGGNVDQGVSGFRYGGGGGKIFDYRVYGKVFTTGPEFHPDGRRFDDWRMQRAGVRMDGNEHNRDTFTLQGDIYSGDTGEKAGVGSFSPPAQINLEQNDEVSGGNLLGRWRREFAGGSDLQVQAYYDRTNRSTLHYGETRDTFDVDFLHHLKVGRQDLLWGLGTRVSPSNFIQNTPTLDITPHHQTDSTYSGFAQDEIQIIQNKLSLTMGTKLEHNNYSGFEIQPTARLLWTPRPRQTLWAAVTRAVRTPSRLEEGIDLKGFAGFLPGLSPPVYVEIAGDPKFVSERLVGYEVGYRSLITSRFYMDISAFHNDYDNLSSYGLASMSIETSPITYILLKVPYANGIKGTTDGFEVAPNWKLTHWWQLKGSYSYLHLDVMNKPGLMDTSNANIDIYRGSSPHHQIIAQSQFNLSKVLEFDQTFRYVSALPVQLVKAYVTADARLGWNATKHLEFSFVGQNLLQPHHAEFGGDLGPLVGIERSAYGKVTWKSTAN